MSAVEPRRRATRPANWEGFRQRATNIRGHPIASNGLLPTPNDLGKWVPIGEHVVKVAASAV